MNSPVSIASAPLKRPMPAIGSPSSLCTSDGFHCNPGRRPRDMQKREYILFDALSWQPYLICALRYAAERVVRVTRASRTLYYRDERQQ